jgi:hypothetical protein
MWTADQDPPTEEVENVALKANDQDVWIPIKRGTTRAACVRALLAVGDCGASVESLVPIMCEQGECTISDTQPTKKYIGKILRSDSIFVRV